MLPPPIVTRAPTSGSKWKAGSSQDLYECLITPLFTLSNQLVCLAVRPAAHSGAIRPEPTDTGGPASCDRNRQRRNDKTARPVRNTRRLRLQDCPGNKRSDPQAPDPRSGRAPAVRPASAESEVFALASSPHSFPRLGQPANGQLHTRRLARWGRQLLAVRVSRRSI